MELEFQCVIPIRRQTHWHGTSDFCDYSRRHAFGTKVLQLENYFLKWQIAFNS